MTTARNPLYWAADEGSVMVNGALLTTRVKNIEVRGGNRDVELLRLFGKNTILAEKPQELFETTITSIVSGNSFSKLVMGAGSTTTYGDVVSGDSVRDRVNIVYTWKDPNTDPGQGPSLRLAFFSGFGISNDMTLGTDNQLEETFTFKCLPAHQRREFSTGAGSTLVTPAS